jgi:hypothetical protein
MCRRLPAGRPELTNRLIENVEKRCEKQADGRSIRELEARRDVFLVELIAVGQNMARGGRPPGRR